MVSRNEGHVTGDGGQSWLEGVASGGGYSRHKAEGLANRLLHHCTWTEGGLAVGHVTVGAELFRPAAFRTCLVGTAGGAVGRPQADGHQEGGDEAKHLHETPQLMTSRMARNRK